VQLTLPNVHSDDLASDDDIDDYVTLDSLPHNSVDGATVAVH